MIHEFLSKHEESLDTIAFYNGLIEQKVLKVLPEWNTLPAAKKHELVEKYRDEMKIDIMKWFKPGF